MKTNFLEMLNFMHNLDSSSDNDFYIETRTNCNLTLEEVFSIKSEGQISTTDCSKELTKAGIYLYAKRKELEDYSMMIKRNFRFFNLIGDYDTVILYLSVD
jgi:hypothetical protein